MHHTFNMGNLGQYHVGELILYINNMEIQIHEDIKKYIDKSYLEELLYILDQYQLKTSNKVVVIGILREAFTHTNYSENSYLILITINGELVIKNEALYNINSSENENKELVNNFIINTINEVNKFIFLSKSKYNINNKGVLS